MDFETKALAEACIEAWGWGAQLDMVQEELTELSLAVSHWKRNRSGAEENVVEEIADVEFMLAQLKVILEQLYEAAGVGAQALANDIVDISENKKKRTAQRIKKNHPELYDNLPERFKLS